jgi:hypothetical protein
MITGDFIPSRAPAKPGSTPGSTSMF